MKRLIFPVDIGSNCHNQLDIPSGTLQYGSKGHQQDILFIFLTRGAYHFAPEKRIFHTTTAPLMAELSKDPRS